MSSWFCVPEQGMTSFELLSRASCFLVETPRHRDEQFHVLGAGHVPFPFRFPQYYPPEQYQWLECVQPHHTKSILELRNENDGSHIASFPLRADLLAHDTRDIVLGSIAEEDHFMEKYRQEFGNNSPALILSSSTPSESSQKAVRIIGCGVDNAGMPDEVTFVQRAEGVVAVATNAHLFAATDTEIKMGICGGPVLASVEGEGEEVVIGMLEGVVSSINTQDANEKTVLQPLQGNAAIIPAQVLADFCLSVDD